MLVQLDSCPQCCCRRLIGLTVRSVAHSSAPKEFNLPEVGQWNLCPDCCFLFQNPRPSRETLEKYYLESGYRVGTEGLVSQGYIEFAPHQLARHHLWFCLNDFDMRTIRRGACLDYGCGIGGALGFLAEQGNECFGVEIDQALAAFGNARFPIRIVPKVEDLPAGKQFDLIMANHSIEHIYDPNDFFTFAAKALTDAGTLVIAVPAWRYSNVISVYEAFSSEDTSVWDHVAMANWLNKHSFYMTTFMYQNYGGPKGDWELVVTAKKSQRKNHFSFSVDEVLAELYGNIGLRCAKPNESPVRERIAVRIGVPDDCGRPAV